jgi:hypothetical protein
MDHHDIERAAAGLADTLASIERGELEATPTERAYLVGALDALRGVVGHPTNSGDQDSHINK